MPKKCFSKNFVILSFLFVIFVFCALFCACDDKNNSAQDEVETPNFATKVEAFDCSVFVGERLTICPTVTTTTNKNYDLGFEFESENQSVFDVRSNILVALAPGTANLTIKAISGFNKNFNKTFFVSTTVVVTVLLNPKDVEPKSLEEALLVGTCATSFYENDFKDLKTTNLNNLQQENDNFVLYALSGDKSAKIEGHTKNFYFYAVIMFDNIDFDWYNFTITCNSNALCVQKISNSVFVLFAEREGECTATLRLEEAKFEHLIHFKTKTVKANSALFCSETNFLMLKNEVLDLTPTILPKFATASVNFVCFENDDVVEIDGLNIVAKNEGSCYVKVCVEEFSKTFLICVSQNEFVVSVPKTQFVQAPGNFVEVNFAVFGTNFEGINLVIEGNTKQLEIDIVLGSLIVFCDRTEEIEIFLVLKDSSTVLARSEKIVITFV